jgi:hypothetical protein
VRVDRIHLSHQALPVVAGAALASLLVLGSVDLAVTRGRLHAAAPGATAVLDGFEPVADDGSRRGDGDSVIRIGGLWAGAAAHIELGVAARGGPRRIRLFANDSQVADVRLGDDPTTVAFDARTSSSGVLRIQLRGGRRDETVYRLATVVLDQEGPRRIPGKRVLQYLVLGGLFGYLAFGIVGSRWSPWAAAVLVLGAAFVVGSGRVLALAHLGVAVITLAIATALRIASECIEARVGMPVWASWPAMLLCAIRMAAVWDLDFGSIDAEWHAKNMIAFAEGRRIESVAPGVARSPYPPAFYAMLAAFRTHDYWTDVRLVRVAMALIEGAGPFLVFGIGVAVGLSAVPAGAAALLSACMPEAVLVLEKGIVANIFGQFAMLLCVLLFAIPGCHWTVRIAAVSLLLLSHAPAAVLGLLLLMLWWSLDAASGRLAVRELVSRLAIVAAAAVVAWAVYYREAGFAFGNASRPDDDVRFVEFHGYRIGKIAQDLVLKFGALPVGLAIVAWRRVSRFPQFQPLAIVWSVVTVGFAAVAVLSPFPLRFEYFAVPLVGLLGGVLAASDARGLWWCWWASAVAVLIQLLLGVLWRLGRFEIIAVIMESPRWPFPVVF